MREEWGAAVVEVRGMVVVEVHAEGLQEGCGGSRDVSRGVTGEGEDGGIDVGKGVYRGAAVEGVGVDGIVLGPIVWGVGR